MQSINNGNLLEIIDLAHSLREEHLYITNEKNTFHELTLMLNQNSSNVAQVSGANISLPRIRVTPRLLAARLDLRPAPTESEQIDHVAAGLGAGCVLLQS